jgi:hypothetical protein
MKYFQVFISLVVIQLTAYSQSDINTGIGLPEMPLDFSLASRKAETENREIVGNLSKQFPQKPIDVPSITDLINETKRTQDYNQKLLDNYFKFEKKNDNEAPYFDADKKGEELSQSLGTNGTKSFAAQNSPMNISENNNFGANTLPQEESPTLPVNYDRYFNSPCFQVLGYTSDPNLEQLYDDCERSKRNDTILYYVKIGLLVIAGIMLLVILNGVILGSKKKKKIFDGQYSTKPLSDFPEFNARKEVKASPRKTIKTSLKSKTSNKPVTSKKNTRVKISELKLDVVKNSSGAIKKTKTSSIKKVAPTTIKRK